MTTYNPQDLFSDAQIYDLIDLVQGGAAGDANIPLKALADRTQYLFKRQGIIEPKRLTGSYTYDAADINKLFAFHISANSSFNLPNVTALVPGTVIRIATRIPVIKALTINCNGSQKIYDGASDVSAMYMHDGERLWLVAAATNNGTTPDHWEILLADGNFFTAGESFGARKVMRNTVINDGALFNRADMPRLWAAVSSFGPGLVSDLTWLSDPNGLPIYRGCFSTGNGTTTGRLPDERAMSDRYLDLGRGIDSARLYDAAGGYEKDSVQEHDHADGDFSRVLEYTGLGTVGTVDSNNPSGSEPDLTQSRPMKKFGGAETNGKNIGKIPLTRY